jgi:ABC-type glycerol-3-phosphate transport system substrate-binding protein
MWSGSVPTSIDSPATLKAVTTLASFVDTYKIMDPALNGTTAGSELPLFGTGVAAMSSKVSW